MIHVTKPFLPPKNDYDFYLDGIWERNWITNHGPLVNQLENKLKEFLQVPNILFLNNGTTALQIAIKALDLQGEIITTPFSYVATTSSIVWEGCKPVFADIDADTFNIDPDKIENLINNNTTAILATHVFGNPCQIESIQTIAEKYNLKVIYDAAHCFGTLFKNESVYNYGDISTASFHATKLFHTGEGGAVFTNSSDLHKKMSYLRNFGHETPTEFAMVGINGKNSELHAAMGLSVLPYVEEIIKKRKISSEYYKNALQNLNFKYQQIHEECQYNYSYFPVVFESEQILLDSLIEFNKYEIFPRRYFYPSLDTLNYVNVQQCMISRDLSSRILCLPLFYDLDFADIDKIVKILIRCLKNKP